MLLLLDLCVCVCVCSYKNDSSYRSYKNDTVQFK